MENLKSGRRRAHQEHGQRRLICMKELDLFWEDIYPNDISVLHLKSCHWGLRWPSCAGRLWADQWHRRRTGSVPSNLQLIVATGGRKAYATGCRRGDWQSAVGRWPILAVGNFLLGWWASIAAPCPRTSRFAFAPNWLSSHPADSTTCTSGFLPDSLPFVYLKLAAFIVSVWHQWFVRTHANSIVISI